MDGRTVEWTVELMAGRVRSGDGGGVKKINGGTRWLFARNETAVSEVWRRGRRRERDLASEATSREGRGSQTKTRAAPTWQNKEARCIMGI